MGNLTRVVVLLTTGLLLVGCGSPEAARPAGSAAATGPAGGAPSSSAQSSPTAAPDGAARCGSPGLASARGVRLPAERGALYALNAGTGARGVLLIHGSGRSGVCVWPKEIPGLAAAGYHVLAIDHSCIGESACPSGEKDLVNDIAVGTRYLLTHGARSVVVVGASAGSAQVVVAAAVADVPLNAAVSLSAARLDSTVRPTGQTPRTAWEAAPLVRVPILYMIAADDTVASVPDTRALHTATPAKYRSIVELPTGGHAQQLLLAGSDLGGPAYQQFIAFLNQHSGK